MSYRVSYDMAEEVLGDEGAVTAFFIRRAQRVAPHGRRANAYWFAPEGGQDMLRVDMDYDAGRAAVRWLPDGTHVVELEPADPLLVLESSDYPPVEISRELARVSTDTACQLAAAFVRTGDRPAAFAWVTD